MRHDRRAAGNIDRRKLCRRVQSLSGLAVTGEAAPSTFEADNANHDSAAPVRDALFRSREGSAELRETTVLAREEQAHVREDTAEGREATALLRENSATSRESILADASKLRLAQRDQSAKLIQANAKLVIAAVESQILAEEIEKSKMAITHLANHDFLTNLPNRMALNERITQAVSSAKRHGVKLALLFLDLDRFKLVNDTLGHAIGDQLLQAVAQRLRTTMRSSDTVSRHGGDEFILVLSEVSDEAAVAANAEKIHAVVTAPYIVSGHTLVIGATIGISIFPDDDEDPDTLIRNADAAMYYAKQNGRNKYQFFNHDILARDTERQHVEASLYEALDQQQFVLFYQAQISLESGAVIGAEALIRWHHPTRGLLLPSWFVAVAEECGAIVPIGRWVLHEACGQARSWLDAGLPFNVIAVNISASEFENEDFVKNVCAVLKETGLTADHLELELTETVLMKDLASTAATLDALRLMGVRISIDDFGTGYSSLSYLKRLPVDTMKIDQSFVRDISNNEDDVLINAVIGIGKSLHHHVVAEGVETPMQLAFLKEHRCPAAQGFYLQAPMIAAEFTAFLKQGVPPDIFQQA